MLHSLPPKVNVPVYINIHYVDIFAFGKFFTDTNLRLDTLLVLALRTESGVDNSVVHCFSSEKKFIFSANELSGNGGTVKE